MNQYTVRWRNASDMSQVFFERSRFRRQGLNDRYSVDDRTFALLIDNVEPSDAANPYVCEVSVFIASQDRLYDNSRTTNQTLTVFGKLTSNNVDALPKHSIYKITNHFQNPYEVSTLHQII